MPAWPTGGGDQAKYLTLTPFKSCAEPFIAWQSIEMDKATFKADRNADRTREVLDGLESSFRSLCYHPNSERRECAPGWGLGSWEVAVSCAPHRGPIANHLIRC